MIDLSEISDFFRNGTNNGIIVLLLFLLCGPALADSNFVIQRMVQYDFNSIPFGSRASAINMEAKSIENYHTRNCIFTRFQDLTIEKFKDAIERGGAGGFIIVLPQNFSMSIEEKESIFELEQALMSEAIPVPVYFLRDDEGISSIISELSFNKENSRQKDSASHNLMNKISANLYQVIVSGNSHSPKKESRIPVIQGELIPFKQTSKPSEDNQQIPVIIITTQLKTFGITHFSPPNYDTTVLLTLIDAFSKLYNQMSSSAKYRLVFVHHESGSLLNFVGAKKYLDMNDVSVNAEFAICLDSIAEKTDLLMHVSKPIKDGPVSKFYDILTEKAALYGGKNLTHVHRKINLAETFHKWAHERFSMKRVNAFTLSSLESHRDPLRTTIFSEHSSGSSILQSGEDQLDDFILDNIQTNVKILAESLATYIFFRENEESGEIFTGPMELTRKSFQPYIAMKSLSKSQNIKLTYEKFLKNVKVYYDVPSDPKEPEFLFYDGEEAVLNVYNVKPAVFDLFLTSLIACYLFGVYFIVVQFPKFYNVINQFSTSSRPSQNGGTNHKSK